MSLIRYNKEVCEYLQIPSIPKKVWDRTSSFDKGVAVVRRYYGGEGDYVACTYNSEADSNIRIIRDFANIRFSEIIEVYPVPSYMNDNIDEMDFDNSASIEAMEQLLQEKKELVNDGIEMQKTQIYEWGYPFITTKQEAIAFLKSKNVKGRLPEKEEVLKLKLQNMYRKEHKL